MPQFHDFNGIFSGNFTVSLSNSSSYGPLVVGGEMSAENYTVNAATDTICSSDNFGLIVSGGFKLPGLIVGGNAYLSGYGDVTQVMSSCSVTTVDAESLFNYTVFDSVNQLLSSMEPNLVLSSDASLISVATSGPNDTREFNAMTFSTCSTANCKKDPAFLSDPSIFYDTSTEIFLPTDKTLVLNVI